jgi:hypothetical protein
MTRLSRGGSSKEELSSDLTSHLNTARTLDSVHVAPVTFLRITSPVLHITRRTNFMVALGAVCFTDISKGTILQIFITASHTVIAMGRDVICADTADLCLVDYDAVLGLLDCHRCAVGGLLHYMVHCHSY